MNFTVLETVLPLAAAPREDEAIVVEVVDVNEVVVASNEELDVEADASVV